MHPLHPGSWVRLTIVCSCIEPTCLRVDVDVATRTRATLLSAKCGTFSSRRQQDARLRELLLQLHLELRGDGVALEIEVLDVGSASGAYGVSVCERVRVYVHVHACVPAYF